MTVCNTCGLPKDLCVCETIAKESQKIIISVEKKKFNKKYTIIEGIDEKSINMDDLIKKLKAKFACGGTYKEGKIELQGAGGKSDLAEKDHKQKAKEILLTLGFAPETIQIK